jgi:hypothetical protein
MRYHLFLITFNSAKKLTIWGIFLNVISNVMDCKTRLPYNPALNPRTYINGTPLQFPPAFYITI